MKKIAVFASGSGTNCENIINYFAHSQEARVGLVVCNNAKAEVLNRARRCNVPCVVVDKIRFSDHDYVLSLLQQHEISIVVLAGFLLMVPDYLVDAYQGRIINIHPALLPKFGGVGMYGKHVHTAVKNSGEKETGMTVHHVTNVCDGGEIIAQYSCEILPTDTIDDIAMKEHALEMKHFPKVIEDFLRTI